MSCFIGLIFTFVSGALLGPWVRKGLYAAWRWLIDAAGWK